jgi:hypothetical protein
MVESLEMADDNKAPGGAQEAPSGAEETQKPNMASVDPALTVERAGQEECSICCEVMGGDVPQRKLACGHCFHPECIKRWLKQNPTCPMCKADEPGEGGDKPQTTAFHVDLGHQEMQQILHELEDIFMAVHQCAGPDHPVAVNGLAYNLCTSLGYEDEDELEESIGGSLVDFMTAMPHFTIHWPENPEAEDAVPRATMLPEPEEDEDSASAPGVRVAFTVGDRADLWRVALQGRRADVEIPEIEFTIRPQGKRRVDTIYNMIASAVFNLGDHVRKNSRAGGISDIEVTRITETIDQLNKLLDVEESFTFVICDPQGVSELKPSEGAHVGPLSEFCEPTPVEAQQ